MDDLHLDDSKPPNLYLPKGWPSIATESILHVLAMARLTIMQTAAWPSDCETLDLRTKNKQLEMENSLLQQELDIKNARMDRIPPHKRSVPDGRWAPALFATLRSARQWNSTASSASRESIVCGDTPPRRLTV
jgi:hypothetical protein